MIQKTIMYMGRPQVLACDARCEKAWGINGRPKNLLSPVNPDDYEFLADDELGRAPANPGSYEGGVGKPQRALDLLNKWCARECERSVMVDVGQPLELPDFSKRRPNIPRGA